MNWISLINLIVMTSLPFANSEVKRKKPLVSPEPTQGLVWPLPHKFETSSSYFSLNKDDFEFKLDESVETCTIIINSLERFRNRIFKASSQVSDSFEGDSSYSGTLTAVHLILKNGSECNGYPHSTMDESYQISVKIKETGEPSANLVGQSTWGLLRSLESFSQITYKSDNDMILLNLTNIEDKPAFPHRGLLIDTSRHFITLKVLKLNLDLMEMNKMNLLHWHLVDDQSFPYKSESFPLLSGRGAYNNKTHVYTKGDIQSIIEYGRIRAIRVVPEFDTPGHTQSWGMGYPYLLTTCYSKGQKIENEKGPMNPASNETYQFLEKFFKEVSSTFKDSFIHLGGDEVEYSCWASNPEVKKVMAINKWHNFSELENYFFKRLTQTINKLNKRYIVWNDVVNRSFKISQEAIVQLWQGNMAEEIDNLTEKGYQVIVSEPWYLDYLSTTWEQMYSFNHMDEQNKRLLGGEACMWGELVNSVNLLPTVWPRTCSVAEKLWTGSISMKQPIDYIRRRIQEHECRLLERGYPIGPTNGPAHCNYAIV